MTDSTERDWVAEVGAPAYAAIVEMVAALGCDYDRLDELRDTRDIYNREQRALAWAEENPEDAEELAALEEEAGECEDEDAARQRIEEDALSVEVRSDWHTPGDADRAKASEFRILLTTGGPAVQLRGELDEYQEPHRAWLEVQDWGKPWTRYFPADQDTLLRYARCFSFAE